MLCKNPYLKSASQPYGCGQCMPCRYNRRRLWANRIMLEAKMHAHSSFVTLTYGPEALPPGGTLVPKHTQDWLKRLRKGVEHPLRFFLVGEYGDLSNRPHYHAAIFGLPGCLQNHLDEYRRSKCNCSSCLFIRETWKHGKTDNAYLTLESANYVAGYVTKKLTRKGDPKLGDRHPEFARMSLKPGIGATAARGIADALSQEYGVDTIIQSGDVPTSLRNGKKTLPLGRYLRRKIRETLGHKETGTPQEVLLRLQQEKVIEIENELKKPENKSNSVKKILLDLNKQKVLNLETRIKIFSKKGSL